MSEDNVEPSSSTTVSGRKFKLISSDKQEFIVSENVVKQSILFTTMLEQFTEETETDLPVPGIDGTTLKKIVEFCEHFENEPPYIPPANNEDGQLPNELSWEFQCLKVPSDDFMKIINAANYLNIERLIDACCAKMMLMIRGRGVEEIRKIFKIENDFTPEEEEGLRRDHIWYDCPLPPKTDKQK